MAHVLLVEDIEDVLYILGRMLQRLGHTVVKTSAAEQALQALRSERFDAVVTDVWMPGTGGIALIEALKADRPGLPVVAISGGAPRRPLQRSLDSARLAGADATLLKPVDRAELGATLDALLGSRAAG
ncbi:response regulator [Marinibaculum pumilum]|uniref:Response regulator n=1 Tax=Marinibaculum pumilum TaxID=1766165 RepID=A0ABV7KTT1_9PROT